MSEFTTSLRLDAAHFDAQFPGSFSYSVDGARLESENEKTIIMDGVTVQELEQAVTSASAAFVQQETLHSQVENDLRSALPILRQWSDDALQAYSDWPTKTNVQKDTAMREVIQRLGIFFDRFADLLISIGKDQ